MLAVLKRLVTAEDPSIAAGPPAFRRYALAGLAAGTAVVAGAVVGGTAYVSHLPGAWFFGSAGGPLGSVSTSSPRSPAVAVLCVYGGMVALATVWWRLVRHLRACPGVPVRHVARTLALWALPFVVAPPLFSRDVYSYAGQGALVNFHIDPYTYGPGVLGATPFNLLAGPLWANTPSPYGPTFLSLDGLAAHLSSHDVLADLVLLRLLAIIGVALVVAGLPTLARAAGRDPAVGVVLGAGSPLALGTLVGGAHNDALMIGLLVAGLAVWKRLGPVPGIVLCALAAGVKAPAALGVVVIGWNWVADAGAFERIRRTVVASGIGAATLAALSEVTGIGWGWMGTVTAPDKVSTGVTPVDAVARAVSGLMHLAGSTAAFTSVRSVASVAGLAVALAVGSWLVWHSPATGPIRSLGLSLLVLSLLGPVLWAWYAAWGLVVLAPVATGRLCRVAVWLTIAESLIGVSSVLGTLRTMAQAGVLVDVLVVVGVAGAGILAARPSYGRPVPPTSNGRTLSAASDGWRGDGVGLLDGA